MSTVGWKGSEGGDKTDGYMYRECDRGRERERREIGGERESELEATIEWHGIARSDRCNNTVLYLFA